MERWPHPSITDAPVALMVHGTGSNPEFLRRCFVQSTHAHGYSLASYRLRGHGPHPQAAPAGFDRLLEDLAAAVEQASPQVLGGVSLGAHLSAAFAAAGGAVGGLLLVFPAWTGAPDSVAAANAHQAEAILAKGTDRCLRELDAALAGSDLHWVYDEMAATWPEHEQDHLVEIFRRTAESAAPGLPELARISIPTSVVSSVDDPLHPLAVGQTWARAVPAAVLSTLSMHDLAPDRALLGELAWKGLSGSR